MTATAPVLALERLDLVLFRPAFIDALVSGRRDEATAALDAEIPRTWPDEHDSRFLRLRREQATSRPETGEWLARGLVLRDGRQLVGYAGFHGPPGVNGQRRSDAVELGYSVFEPFRGQGYASEAAAGLVEWARKQQGVRAILASVAPGNEPSLAIVRKLGFVHVGEQWDDEDGLELVYELASR